tara:strand:- start:295 stop:1716 length:1422 start_codon:yes stop_codon:yes gene_type:complete
MSNINSGKQKFTYSTDTDLHFEMLADPSKLKVLPSLVEKNNSIPELDENEKSSDSEIIENESYEEIETLDNSPEFHKEEERNFSNFNDEEKTDFLRQKAIHDFNKNNYQKNFKKEKEKSKYESSDDNSFSKKSNYDIPSLNELKNMDEVPFHMLDSQTKKFKKMEKYAELLSIKRTGITLTKNYNLESDYEEMCFEVKYWNNFQNKKDGVELGKGFLVNAVTALEFMNESYDPFGLKLKGWSEQMELNKESYSSVLGELYDKYKSSGKKMEPEIKLILMISASAASFHASKKMAESLPGLDSVLQSNPELLSKLQGAINNNISNQGKKKTESQEEIQKKMYEQMQKVKQQQQRLEELKKAQANVNNNTQKIEEQMNMLKRTQNKKENNLNEGKSDLTSILTKIKAQNVARKADEVLNNKLSESSSSSEEQRVSIKSDKNSESMSTTSITFGSDGKPKKKKRNGKSTISIVTTE